MSFNSNHWPMRASHVEILIGPSTELRLVMFGGSYSTEEAITIRQPEFEGNKNYIAFRRTGIYYDAEALKKKC